MDRAWTHRGLALCSLLAQGCFLAHSDAVDPPPEDPASNRPGGDDGARGEEPGVADEPSAPGARPGASTPLDVPDAAEPPLCPGDFDPDCGRRQPWGLSRGTSVLDVDFEREVTDGSWGRAAAVAREGHYFVREGGGSIDAPSRWTLAYFFERELSGGVVAGDAFVLWGPSRLWHLETEGPPEAQQIVGCDAELGLQSVFPREGGNGHGTYVSDDGLVIARSDRGSCMLQSLEGDRRVIDATTAPCGGSLNPRVLTSQRLVGRADCVVPP